MIILQLLSNLRYNIPAISKCLDLGVTREYSGLEEQQRSVHILSVAIFLWGSLERVCTGCGLIFRGKNEEFLQWTTGETCQQSRMKYDISHMISSKSKLLEVGPNPATPIPKIRTEHVGGAWGPGKMIKNGQLSHSLPPPLSLSRCHMELPTLCEVAQALPLAKVGAYKHPPSGAANPLPSRAPSWAVAVAGVGWGGVVFF